MKTHEETLQCDRETRVGMVKENRNEKDCLPYPQLKHARPISRSALNGTRSIGELGRNGIAVPSTHLGRDRRGAEDEISRERDLMIRPMPPPQGVIEDHDRHDRCKWLRHRRSIEQTDAMALRPFSDRHQDWRLKQREESPKRCRRREIPNHVAQLRLEHLSKWRDRFPRREEQESAANHADRDRVLR